MYSCSHVRNGGAANVSMVIPKSVRGRSCSAEVRRGRLNARHQQFDLTLAWIDVILKSGSLDPFSA